MQRFLAAIGFIAIVGAIWMTVGAGVRAQEATTTEATSTQTEGTDVLPGGEPITTTTPSTTVHAAPFVYIQSFDERIAEITNPDVRQLVELKTESDLLLSHYAKLYDSCRFSR